MEESATPLILAVISSIVQGHESKQIDAHHGDISRRISGLSAERLRESYPATKFVVQTLLTPSHFNLGLAMSSAAVWDTSRDCTFNVKWESKELIVIVSVVAIST